MSTIILTAFRSRDPLNSISQSERGRLVAYDKLKGGA